MIEPEKTIPAESGTEMKENMIKRMSDETSMYRGTTSMLVMYEIENSIFPPSIMKPNVINIETNIVV
jgi:hypothetical protein